MSKLFTNKKASFFDNISVFIFLVVIIFVLFMALFINNAVNNAFSNSNLDTTAKTLYSGYTTKYQALADGSVVLWFIILWIGTIILSWFIDSQPIWFVIFFILSAISFFILAPLANAAVGVLSDSAFTAIVTSMPITMFILNHLLAFNAFFIATVGIVLYMKYR